MIQSIQEVIDGRSRWTLIGGECQDVFRAMEPQSVDHVICDPPYDAETHAGAREYWGKGKRWRNGKMKERAHQIAIDFDPLKDIDGLVASLLRLSRRWVVCFSTLEMLGEYRWAAGKNYIRGGLWDRTDGTPQLSGDRPAQSAEGLALLNSESFDALAVMHADGKKIWNGGGKRGKWTHGVEREGRIHPTQKPIGLMLELIRDFTDPDDLVLDPFAGSGTTGAACIQLGRRFIGVEANPEYAEAARARLVAEVQGDVIIRREKLKQVDLLDVLERSG